MNVFSRLSIRFKLALLAGVPVIGALLLAGVILRDARERAATAAALGSIEDLAQLSSQMSGAMHALQSERARVALREGLGEKPAGADVASQLGAQYAETDKALGRLESFLSGRDLSKLPARLANDLASARDQMSRRAAFRTKAEHEEVPVDEIVAFYAHIDESLISATAALTELSDDGELLRAISGLVALSELSERGSSEHALLAYVFAQGQFPPGAFKALVTNVTEQAVYADVFRANATEELTRRWAAEREAPAVKHALELRDKALTTTDDTLDIDVDGWFKAQEARLGMLSGLERSIMSRIEAAASSKVAATRSAIRVGVGLSTAVVVLSALLGWIIVRGITRTIYDLSSSAARVRETKDFGIRARKSSTDELGTLTDAFNEMLSGIQARDHELEEHRTGLESMVAARTAQLAARNEAMRLVLDNVEQGLATVQVDGTFSTERSAAFDALLGSPTGPVVFADHVAAHDERTREMLKLGWEMVGEDVFPLDIALDQLPKRMSRDGVHFTLGFKPIMREDKFDGALMVVTNVTAEVQARLEQEKQREYIAVFERVAQDRDGFMAFSAETGALLDRLAEGVTDVPTAMALVHTVKGNAAQWGVSSVARIAHELETQVVDTSVLPTDEQKTELFAAWKAMSDRVKPLVGGPTDRLELTRAEVDELLVEMRARAAHDIADKLERLKHEPAAVRFQRMCDDVERLAPRLGKPKPRVTVESNGVRLPASRFGSFWASTVHVVRNMMDHGVESAEDRVAKGKAPEGSLVFRSSATPEGFTVEFEDDGRGINWEGVAAKAREAGIPADTAEDLERALFASGVSTAGKVTDISGRGVGLSAVAERCAALGGVIRVTSKAGEGSKFAFFFPRRTNEHSIIPMKRAS